MILSSFMYGSIAVLFRLFRDTNFGRLYRISTWYGLGGVLLILFPEYDMGLLYD